MAKARDIHRRIRSVENTKKITRTMEMVAASKLRRAQDRVLKARPYAQRLASVIENLITPELSELQPILRQPDRIRRAAVVLMTSNRGLCGGFNVNLGRRTRDGLEQLHEAGVETELHVIGKKGVSMFRFRGIPMASARSDITDWPTLEDARSIIEPLANRFIDGELDAIYIVHAEFKSMLSTPPNTVQLLPVHVPADRPKREPYYILDPSAEEILSRLLPLYLTNATFRALVESAAAEQASRRTAMKSATDNAEEFIHNLRRTYNRARQQEITSQLAEIIGGAEALAQG
jgi:F-type H+-transporting ATPase subunit gamma